MHENVLVGHLTLLPSRTVAQLQPQLGDQTYPRRGDPDEVQGNERRSVSPSTNCPDRGRAMMSRRANEGEPDIGSEDGPNGTGGPTARPVQPRPVCPSCGSSHTQPFPHAGPGARVNMQCIDCRHLFKDKDLRA